MRERLGILDDEMVVRAGQRHRLAARDRRRHSPGRLGGHDRAVLAVHDERGHRDLREERPGIDRRVEEDAPVEGVRPVAVRPHRDAGLAEMAYPLGWRAGIGRRQLEALASGRHAGKRRGRTLGLAARELREVVGPRSQDVGDDDAGDARRMPRGQARGDVAAHRVTDHQRRITAQRCERRHDVAEVVVEAVAAIARMVAAAVAAKVERQDVEALGQERRDPVPPVAVGGERVQEQGAGPLGVGPEVRAQPQPVTGQLAPGAARDRSYQGKIAGRWSFGRSFTISTGSMP